MAIWKGRGRVSNRSGDVSDEDNAHDMGREKMNGYCVRSQGTQLVTNEIMTVDDSTHQRSIFDASPIAFRTGEHSVSLKRFLVTSVEGPTLEPVCSMA